MGIYDNASPGGNRAEGGLSLMAAAAHRVPSNHVQKNRRGSLLPPPSKGSFATTMTSYKAAVDNSCTMKCKMMHEEVPYQTIEQLRAELALRDQAVEIMAISVKEWLRTISRTVPNQYHVREVVHSAAGILAEFMEAYSMDRSAIEQEAQCALNLMIMRSSPVTVDLHDTNLYDAVKYVEHVIAENAPNRRTLHIVTGKGNQSGNEGPVIRPAVQRVLDEKGLKWAYGKTINGDANEGMLVVYL